MGRKIVRYCEGPRRTGYGKTKFRDEIINTGRLKLVPLGPRAVGLVEDELDAVVAELIAARDTATTEQLAQLKAARTPVRIIMRGDRDPDGARLPKSKLARKRVQARRR